MAEKCCQGEKYSHALRQKSKETGPFAPIVKRFIP